MIHRFQCRSSVSFTINFEGRQKTINFSPLFRNLSTYITSNESLAEMIRAHKWVRKGMIKEIIEDESAVANAPEEMPVTVSIPPKRPAYTIRGKKMSVVMPPSATKNDNADVAVAAMEAEKPVEASPAPVTEKATPLEGAITAEEVTSFSQAKEYLVETFGVSRGKVLSKAALANYCTEHGITFPNYEIG